MEIAIFFVYLIAWLVPACIFGFIARYIANSKGYDTGFAWGFWLGVIGLLVVGFRPTLTTYSGSSTQSEYWKNISAAKSTPDDWTCVCGQSNAHSLTYCTKCRRSRDESASAKKPKVECRYCGANNNSTNETCFACGRSLSEQSAAAASKPLVSAAAPVEEPKMSAADTINLDALKKLAELRDMGVLTEDEFQEKKAAILAKI